MVHGLESWRWIFIIEGAITAGCAILCFSLLLISLKKQDLNANERTFET